MKYLLVAALLFSSILFAQSKAASPIRLQGGSNYNGSTFTPEIGPIAVAPHTKLGDKGSRFEADVVVPADGWITSFDRVQLNGSTDTDPASLNLFVEVTNPSRDDLLCHGRDEHIVNYGPGRPAWTGHDGYGYRVKADARLHVIVTLANPGSTPIGWDSLSVVLNFQPYNNGALLRDAFPMWFDVKGCGDSTFDLKPGTNISSGTFEVPLDGQLVALQPALEKYGTELTFGNYTHLEEFIHVSPKADGSLPLQTPAEGVEWRLPKGDFVTISATYNNPGKKDALAAATGIALGLFVPADETAVTKLMNNSAAASVAQDK